MTKPDALTALEGKWMREGLCKCRADGINPDAVNDLVRALKKLINAIEFTSEGAMWQPDKEIQQARAALAKAKAEPD
ncbi:MAG TPA: hypothetical protein ENH62_16195 [Marinobacter sp.]|nr:hypothetical protein [Marinobacter sp.]